MPRRPTRTHPLRQIRNAIGLSQTQFSHLIGVTTSTVKRIENGQLKISQELTGRILLATGVIVLETGRGLRSIFCAEEPYGKSSFEKWRTEFTPSSSVALALAAQLATWIEILLLASARPAVGKSFQVFLSLIQALEGINREFELQKHIDAHLTERHSTETQLYRVGDLRNNSLLAKMVNFQDSPDLLDAELIPLTKPTGWLQHRDLFNMIWNNREILGNSIERHFENLPSELSEKFRQIEKDLEKLI